MSLTIPPYHKIMEWIPSRPMATWITPRSSQSVKFVGTRNAPPYHGADPGQPECDLQVRVGLRRRILFRNGASAVVFQARLPPRQFVRRRTPQRSRCSRAFLVACTRRGGQHPALCSSRRIRQVANGGDRRTVRARRSHVALPPDQTVPALALGAGWILNNHAVHYA